MESTSAESTLYEVFTRLVRVQTRLWNEVDARLRAAHAIPLTQYTILELVSTTPRCRVQDIVRTLHITVGGVSKMVDRLQAAGWLVSTANPDDRRSTVLVVTAAGQQLLALACSTVEDVLTEHLAGPLTHEGLGDLDAMMRRLQAAWDN